ncbi:MAG TPA: hypothetical protein VGS22_11280 [Thermoanaerobaculia bacterium]|jgi:hypothetical protein|nr:hypothetical protein [Thermoanaerobaculia bacterium]
MSNPMSPQKFGRLGGGVLCLGLVVLMAVWVCGPARAESAQILLKVGTTDAVPAGAVCAAVTSSLTLPEPIQLATQKCCLDDWQPGPCNPVTQKYFSLCTTGSGCSQCGTFSCVPNTTMCLR